MGGTPKGKGGGVPPRERTMNSGRTHLVKLRTSGSNAVRFACAQLQRRYGWTVWCLTRQTHASWMDKQRRRWLPTHHWLPFGVVCTLFLVAFSRFLSLSLGVVAPSVCVACAAWCECGSLSTCVGACSRALQDDTPPPSTTNQHRTNTYPTPNNQKTPSTTQSHHTLPPTQPAPPCSLPALRRQKTVCSSLHVREILGLGRARGCRLRNVLARRTGRGVVDYPRDTFAHERVAVWPLRDGSWVGVTPERDVYREDLLCRGCQEQFLCGVPLPNACLFTASTRSPPLQCCFN